jgi:hypothetical protein
MAGVAFGITKVDEGCELRSNAVILQNMGHPVAAAYLLSRQPAVQDALDYENKTGKYAAIPATAVAPVVQAPADGVQRRSELSIPDAMEQTQRRSGLNLQGS